MKEVPHNDQVFPNPFVAQMLAFVIALTVKDNRLALATRRGKIPSAPSAPPKPGLALRQNGEAA
jgi:hypothetical protein